MLLCFDGSDDAVTAIARAAELLAPRRAVVLTVWEPVATWEPYDPATVLSAPMSKLVSRELGVDEIAAELAEEKVKQGVALASSAGFAAQGRVTHGKTWRAICDVAREIDAAAIVLGGARTVTDGVAATGKRLVRGPGARGTPRARGATSWRWLSLPSDLNAGSCRR